MENLLERFADDLARHGLCPKTRRTYLNHVGRFLSRQKSPSEALGEREARDWLVHLWRDKGLGTANLRGHVNALRAFFNATLHRPGATAGILNPCQSAPPPAPPLSAPETDRLLAVLGTDTARAAVTTAYGGGMALNEVCRLETSDIDSRQMLVRLRGGDRPNHRWDTFVPLDRFTLEVLRGHWRRANPPVPWIFTGPDHAPLDPNLLEGELREAARRTAIHPSQLGPTLRYSFLLRRLQEGAALHEVRHLLRHTSIRALPPAVLPSKGGRP